MYHGSRVSTKLKVAGVELATMGEPRPAGADDEVVAYSEPTRGVYKKLVIREGRPAGGIVLGDAAITPRLLRIFDRHETPSENRAELLFSLHTTAPSPADLPHEAQVCYYNGVSKGQIVSAVKRGCRSLKTVCDATRVGTGCGARKGKVQMVLEMAAESQVVEDASASCSVPGVPLPKSELRGCQTARSQERVRSVRGSR